MQKLVQNNKKFCLSCSISQEPHTIWLLFMLHMCKMIISPVFFHLFKLLIFQKILSVMLNIKGIWLSFLVRMYKMITPPCTFFIFSFFHGPKWQKNSICWTPYLRNITSYDCHLWYTFVKWYLLLFQCFFCILKILIFWVHSG